MTPARVLIIAFLCGLAMAAIAETQIPESVFQKLVQLYKGLQNQVIKTSAEADLHSQNIENLKYRIDFTNGPPKHRLQHHLLVEQRKFTTATYIADNTKLALKLSENMLLRIPLPYKLRERLIEEAGLSRRYQPIVIKNRKMAQDTAAQADEIKRTLLGILKRTPREALTTGEALQRLPKSNAKYVAGVVEHSRTSTNVGQVDSIVAKVYKRFKFLASPL